MIRVGRAKYKGNSVEYPQFPGFVNIHVMMRSHSKWYPLSPYELKDEKGRIHENMWQFQKVYESIPAAKETYSGYNNATIWEWPAQTHIKDGKFTQEFYTWRQTGTNHKKAVRYPVGKQNMHKCIGFIREKDMAKPQPPILGYVQARLAYYIPEYIRLVSQQPLFFELLNMLQSGTNLLIVEVDGPHGESLPYYTSKYGVDSNFIIGETMLATHQNLAIMYGDEKHPFGHGYCLAMALLGYKAEHFPGYMAD